jgi:hypothetical protein
MPPAYAQYLQTLAALAGDKQPEAVAARVRAIEQRIAELHWDKVDNRDPSRSTTP